MLAGLAGTGKTTTAIEVINQLRAMGMRPAVCTPTGKAAHVLNKKDPTMMATTLHRTLSARPYDMLEAVHRRLDELEAMSTSAQGLSDDEKKEEADLLKKVDSAKRGANSLGFEPITTEDFLEEGHDMLVFDEASMIGSKTAATLINHINVPMIFIGDNAQLPPVNEEAAVNLDRADVKLTEILRQGADSGILKVAHGITKGKIMPAKEMMQYPDLGVVKDHSPAAVRHLCGDHQMIVWKNDERHALNPYCRIARGFEFSGEQYPYWPMVGEKLMVDQNDYDRRLMRGQILTVSKLLGNNHSNPYLLEIEATDEEDRLRHVVVNISDLVKQQLVKKGSVEDQRSRRTASFSGLAVQFAYTITCHKAQGSEYDKVCVATSLPLDGKRDEPRWFYTACTRAKNNLVLASYHFAHE